MDAGCLSLHFIADWRLRKYFDDIEDEAKLGHVSSVNMSEFYYKTCLKTGRHVTDLRYYQLRRTKVRIVETDEELTRAAGLEKCRQPHKLSLADCYALSLAKKLKAMLLTTDGELAKANDVKTLYFKPLGLERKFPYCKAVYAAYFKPSGGRTTRATAGDASWPYWEPVVRKEEIGMDA